MENQSAEASSSTTTKQLQTQNTVFLMESDLACEPTRQLREDTRQQSQQSLLESAAEGSHSGTTLRHNQSIPPPPCLHLRAAAHIRATRSHELILLR